LTVFRTSQAYARFWEGSNIIHRMMGSWVDAVSAAFAFTRYSSEHPDKIKEFKHVLVRLVSLLNAMVLGELEGMEAREKREFEYELLDIASLTQRTLEPLKKTKCGPIMVHHWVQEVIVNGVKSGVMSIPPPLLTVVFQELGHGMVMYQEGVQLTRVRFPFPYTMTTVVMLCIISVSTPVVFLSWTTGFFWPVLFTFLLVFTFWALHFTAGELENPFGDDANDLDMRQIQSDVNARLLTLLHSRPELPDLCVSVNLAGQRLNILNKVSLKTFEHVLGEQGEQVKKRKSDVYTEIVSIGSPSLSQRLGLSRRDSNTNTTRTFVVSTGATRHDRRSTPTGVTMDVVDASLDYLRQVAGDDCSQISDSYSDLPSDVEGLSSCMESAQTSTLWTSQVEQDHLPEARASHPPAASVPRTSPKPWNFTYKQHEPAPPPHQKLRSKMPEGVNVGDTFILGSDSVSSLSHGPSEP